MTLLLLLCFLIYLRLTKAVLNNPGLKTAGWYGNWNLSKVLWGSNTKIHNMHFEVLHIKDLVSKGV